MALAFGLLLGGADAGEDLRAMRASASGGRAEVSLAKAVPGAERELVAADGAAKPLKARDAVEIGYIAWKNTCLRIPLMIAGRSLEVPPDGGYGAARPYARLLEEKTGFWEYLFRELTPG